MKLQSKKNFVQTCKKYLELLDIRLTFEEISEMSNMRFKQLETETENRGGRFEVSYNREK